MLVRLTYASREAETMSPEQLQAILRQSKANNTAAGVTGVLCRAGGMFLQVLEGGRSPVNALYQRIARDRRHRDVELIAYEQVGERRFAGWAMGQVDLAGLNPAVLLKYSETTALDPYAVTGPVAMALFDDLVATASIVCTG
jgi:hypothetical protein